MYNKKKAQDMTILPCLMMNLHASGPKESQRGTETIENMLHACSVNTHYSRNTKTESITNETFMNLFLMKS